MENQLWNRYESEIKKCDCMSLENKRYVDKIKKTIKH